MAIHWQVKFRSLRSNELYTVNIYDSAFSDTPVQLLGAAEPFVTQEDNSDDMFAPVRTQSGYIRIVNDGTVNWRSIIPTTDISRPVTLTDSNGNVKWQGFMQAQNFGSELYNTPKEIEFPIQCSLSVISREDIGIANKNLQNFGYLLKEIVDAIPEVCRPTEIVVQGGTDALSWLYTRIDWYLMSQEDSDFILQPRYDLMTCLENMCQFWGWCARTYGRTLYLACADDSAETYALVIRYSYPFDDLTAIAEERGGFVPTETMMSTLTIGNIFASTNNNDYQMRGPSKVSMSVNISETDGNLIDPMDSELRKVMVSTPWASGYSVGNVHYSQDVLNVSRNDFGGNATSGYGSFNVAQHFVEDTETPTNSYYEEIGSVFHFKKTTLDRLTNAFSFTSKYQHNFDDGFFRLFGTAYSNGEVMDETEGRWYSGNADMWMRLGIGDSQSNAEWWNGKEWVNYRTVFRATIGNRGDNIFSRWWSGSVFEKPIETMIIPVSQMMGFIYLDFIGTDSTLVPEINSERVFDLKDFRFQFTKNDAVSKSGPYPNSGYYIIEPVDVKSTHVYNSTNNNQNVREELSLSSDYGSEDDMRFGYGILSNTDKSYLTTVPHGGSTVRPEQNIVNRIAQYWETSKRKIECELLAHNGTAATVADGMNPRNKVTIDGSTMYPVSISRNWRDDTVQLILMQL